MLTKAELKCFKADIITQELTKPQEHTIVAVQIRMSLLTEDNLSILSLNHRLDAKVTHETALIIETKS